MLRILAILISVSVLLVACESAPVGIDESQVVISATEPLLDSRWSWDTVEWMFEQDLDDDGTFGLDLESYHVADSDYVRAVGIGAPQTYLKLNDEEWEFLYKYDLDDDILQLDGENARTWEFVLNVKDSAFTYIMMYTDFTFGWDVSYWPTTSKMHFKLYHGLGGQNHDEWDGATIRPNSWVVIDIVWGYGGLNGDSVYTYLDGAWAHSAELPTDDCGVMSSDVDLYIKPGATHHGTLYLDEITIFDRELQGAEIARRYAARWQSGGGSY